MAYINIDIEDYLYQVDTSSLIEELKKCGLSLQDKNTIAPTNRGMLI